MNSTGNENVEWGAVIQTEKRRPGFIRLWDKVKVWNADKRRSDPAGDVEGYYWSEIEAIRLPANHPHYATLSPVQPQGGVQVGGDAPKVDMALYDRLVALAQGMSTDDIGVHDAFAEARAIAALLPEPVDPDLVEARRIMQEKYYINDAEWQGDLETTRAFMLLKRGRALAQGEK